MYDNIIYIITPLGDGEMKAIETHLLSVLSSNDVTFFIPPYQRNYEWDKSQCEVFYQDVHKTTVGNKEGINTEHFFGTIVYVQSEAIFGQPNKLVLTDGQQRITTTMIFLAALRDVIEDKNSKDFINSKYLKNLNSSADAEYKIKLKQVETDWDSYRNIILEYDLTTENKNSAIYKNYSYFINKLRAVKEIGKIDLQELISKGLDKFSIVTIQLEPIKNKWENPQEIFESMNSLGKPLSLADLVRNYLLMGKNAEEQELLYKDYWLPIEKILPGELSNFIRDYMQYKAKKDYKKAKPANYKELYSNFKILFKDSDTKQLLTELKTFSIYYSYIVLGKTTDNNVIDHKLTDLRSINVSIIYSFLLSIFYNREIKKFQDIDVIQILDVIIVYFLRRRILKLTSGENKSFPPLVKKTRQLINSENKKVEMFNILSNQENSVRLPNDIEIMNELKNMNFYNFKYSKFLLSLLEEKITKSRPEADDYLQLEHIMPQTLNLDWEDELGDEYESVHLEYLNSIGNITLIRHNQELGNKNFSIKKDVYIKNSGLQVAKTEIVNRTKWNKKSIQNRTNWIISIILQEVIPIPENMRNKNNYKQKENGKRENRLSFKKLGLIGETINYIAEPSIEAVVVDDKEVSFENKTLKLSPLTREIENRKNRLNNSGSYQGAQFWEFQGIKLSDIM